MTDRTKNKCGVYVHIPYCKAKCAYCAFVSGCDFGTQQKYVDALLNEISTLRDRNIVVDTVYFGGGTPSCLYRGALSEIMSALRSALHITADAEITAEANPESCDEAFVEEISSAGVNRVSMGLQCANDDVLAKIGRLHTTEDFISAIDRLKRRGFDNLSSDVILGLPGENKNDVVSSINILKERCSHISVYALSVEENTCLYADGYIPDDDEIADMYDVSRSLLMKNGFYRYEVSNFARRGRESRHNLKYWSFRPYIGLGAAAHGFDGVRTRYAHSDDVNDYIIGKPPAKLLLSENDVYNEYVMLALRTERGIDDSAFLSRFGYSFAERNADALSDHEKKGNIICDDRYIRISPDKMFVMNGIIEDFML